MYVAVDRHYTPLYVGQVCRVRSDALVARFADHHAVPLHAVGVWVLAFTDTTDPIVVDWFERRLIEALQPSYNRLLTRNRGLAT